MTNLTAANIRHHCVFIDTVGVASDCISSWLIEVGELFIALHNHLRIQWYTDIGLDIMLQSVPDIQWVADLEICILFWLSLAF